MFCICCIGNILNINFQDIINEKNLYKQLNIKNMNIYCNFYNICQINMIVFI